MTEQKLKDKTLKQMLLDAGYPKIEMFHHYSDLYVFVTPVTTRVIDEWCNEHGYTKNLHCPKFKDRITGKLMYDCAFQCYEEEKKDAHKQ